MLSNKALKEQVYTMFKEEDDIMPKQDVMAILGCIDKLKTSLPIVEIGTWKGKTTAMICEYLKRIGKKNKVITIDAYAGFWNTIDTYPEVIERTKPYNVEIIKGFSSDVKDQIKNASLIFVDGGHTEEVVRQDIEDYFPKCKEYFLLHDINYPGVKEATKDLKIKILSDSGGNTGVGLLENL